jgi:hypothetical protein
LLAHRIYTTDNQWCEVTWPIRMVDAPTLDVGPDGKNGFQRLEIGDAWYAPHLLDPEKAFAASESLSPNYYRDWAGKRAPIIIALPYRKGPGIGSHFCIDGRFWREGVAYGDGWVVTGEAPLITLAPSVNIGSSYHGMLQNGVIGPDLDQR